MEHHSFDLNDKSTGRTYLFIFAVSFVLASMLFLPYIIADKGYFYFLGDYNCQQIPFNMMANKAVKSGDIFWNWYTDLGANFIGSYAFYLLGSPFFWLQLVLPSSIIPMSLPWVLCLKFAVASITSYTYLKRFAANKNYAFLGALMYSFSGFSVYNIFFNHFNEVIALFPLLLIGLEEFMENGKKGFFALAVFINALCNYYFFVAEVVFTVIYWIFRLASKSWPSFSLKKFFTLLFEAVIGFGMAAFIVLPAVLATIQIPRAGTKLTGWGLVTYFESQRNLQILQAFFFPPELPSQLNFYPDAGGKWSSVAAWLPLFGMTGVLTWIRRPKRDWLARIILLLVAMAFIPTLNASFQLLSNSYYTRWFFMLVLMFALATVKSLQECGDSEFTGSLILTALISAGISVPVGIIKDPSTKKPLAAYPDRLWAYVGIVALCLLFVYILIFIVRRKSKRFNLIASLMLAFVIVGYGSYFMFLGVYSGIDDPKLYTYQNVNGRKHISLPDVDNVRIDITDGESNAPMYWRIPTIQAFHSIVPGSITEFYTELGITRDVSSKPDLSHAALRPFLSVKYLFDGKNSDDLDVYGFKKIDVQNKYGIWKDENYIPFGFTYDKYISRSNWEKLDNYTREALLLKAIVLEDKDVAKYSGMLKKFDLDGTIDTSSDAVAKDSAARRTYSAADFSRDNRGFDADIDLDADNLVFFSVPYEAGWSATVNGRKADVVKTNIGFMAVRCGKGYNKIRFNYMTPGLHAGLLIGAASAALLLLYLFASPKLLRGRISAPKQPR